MSLERFSLEGKSPRASSGRTVHEYYTVSEILYKRTREAPLPLYHRKILAKLESKVKCRSLHGRVLMIKSRQTREMLVYLVC